MNTEHEDNATGEDRNLYYKIRQTIDTDTGVDKLQVHFEPNPAEYAQNGKEEISFMADPKSAVFVPLNRPFLFLNEEDDQNRKAAEVVRVVLYFEVNLLLDTIVIVHTQYTMPDSSRLDKVVHDQPAEERLDGHIEKYETPNRYSLPDRYVCKTGVRHLFLALQEFAEMSKYVTLVETDFFDRFPEIIDFQSEVTRLFDDFQRHREELEEEACTRAEYS